MVSYPEGDEPLDIVCKEYGISDYEDIELFYYYKNGSVQANFSCLLYTSSKEQDLQGRQVKREANPRKFYSLLIFSKVPTFAA